MIRHAEQKFSVQLINETSLMTWFLFAFVINSSLRALFIFARKANIVTYCSMEIMIIVMLNILHI